MTPEQRSHLHQLVTTVRFTMVRFREGYDMAQVDDLLDELAAAIAADELLEPLVREARFAPVRMREGYDMGEVDDFLQQLVVESGGATTAPPPAATPPRGVESVIVEQRGLLDRIFRRR